MKRIVDSAIPGEVLTEKHMRSQDATHHPPLMPEHIRPVPVAKPEINPDLPHLPVTQRTGKRFATWWSL